MRQAQLPDGTILEFPDETPDAVMDSTVKKYLGAAPEQEPMNPMARGAARFGRSLAGGAGAMLDTIALIPKTAIGTAGLIAGNKPMTDFGTSSTYFRDSALGAIDKATNNQLQPQGFGENAADFIGEMSLPVMTSIKGVDLASKLAGNLTQRAAEKGLSKFGAQAGAKIPELSDSVVRRMTSDEIRKKASDLYKKADQTGGILKPEFTNKFLDDLGDVAPQTTEGQIITGSNPVTELLERAKALKDKPITLQGAQEIDEELGGLIERNTELGRPNKEGRAFLEIQNRLRNAIEDADETSVMGKDGFSTLKEARKLWGRSVRLRDIERVMERAEMTDNPATTIKTGFRNLSMNANKMRGYSAEEKSAIKRAAQSGTLQDITQTFGSRLMTIGGTLVGGGAGGVAASYAGPAISRSLAEKLALNNANRAADMVAKNSTSKVVASPGMSARILNNIVPNIALEDRL